MPVHQLDHCHMGTMCTRDIRKFLWSFGPLKWSAPDGTKRFPSPRKGTRPAWRSGFRHEEAPNKRTIRGFSVCQGFGGDQDAELRAKLRLFGLVPRTGELLTKCRRTKGGCQSKTPAKRLLNRGF